MIRRTVPGAISRSRAVRGATGRDGGAVRGSVSVEVAILTPAFLSLLVLAGVVGRTAVANEAIEVAAHEAARAASISRTAAAARQAARAAVEERLAWEGLACAEPPTLVFAGTVDGSQTSFDAVFTSPLGTDASVVVTVSCPVSTAGLELPLLPELPAYTAAEATYASPVDRYRGRSTS